MTAVILAAGRGKRLGDLTKHCPKPLLLVRAKPIVEHILRGIRGAGIDRAILVVGYLGEQIVAALGNGARLGMDLRYVWQREPRGTAEALLLVQHLVDEPFLLSWGDVLISPQNYRALAEAFAARPAAAWILVNEMADPSAGAAVYFDDSGRVQRIIEKPPPGTSTTCWNNAGVGIYSPAIFHYAERTPLSPRGERELPSALDMMIAAGEAVHALPIAGFWSDVGTPEALGYADRYFDG